LRALVMEGAVQGKHGTALSARPHLVGEVRRE
jgi:hypothetical protein